MRKDMWLLLVLACAQTQSAWSQPKLADKFDIVSVRPSDINGGVALKLDPNVFIMTGMPLRFVLVFAFGIHDYQLTGVPSWVASAHYDIVGKMDEADRKSYGAVASKGAEHELLRQRLQNLLVQRFNLRHVKGVTESGIYALVISKGRPRLTLSEGVPVFSIGPGQLKAENMSLKKLAELLSDATDRMVVDKTGLPGTYAFSLKWLPREDLELDPPGLFTAIQEQLGLKLVSQRGAVPTVTVTHMEAADPN